MPVTGLLFFLAVGVRELFTHACHSVQLIKLQRGGNRSLLGACVFWARNLQVCGGRSFCFWSSFCFLPFLLFCSFRFCFHVNSLFSSLFFYALFLSGSFSKLILSSLSLVCSPVLSRFLLWSPLPSLFFFFPFLSFFFVIYASAFYRHSVPLPIFHDSDKAWDFVFWPDWDTNSPAIAGLLVVVSSTLQWLVMAAKNTETNWEGIAMCLVVWVACLGGILYFLRRWSPLFPEEEENILSKLIGWKNLNHLSNLS